MLPIAFGLVLGSGLSHKLNHRLGTPKQVAGALAIVALTLATVPFWQPETPTWALAAFFFVLPFAMGNVMAPATATVMSAVPEAKAGVGSAMNDVNRQVGGALGVAIIGSFASSLYASRVDSATTALPEGAAHTAGDSVGGAAAVAAQLPAPAGDALTVAANGAFTDAMGLALLIGSTVLIAAAVLVKRLLPSDEHLQPEESRRHTRSDLERVAA
jgi:DHA2 family integral membrane protein (MFS transporter)